MDRSGAPANIAQVVTFLPPGHDLVDPWHQHHGRRGHVVVHPVRNARALRYHREGPGLDHSLLVAAALLVVLAAWFYERANNEVALVKTGVGGRRVMIDGSTLATPFFHEITRVNMQTLRLDMASSDDSALITTDRVRVDVGAKFYASVSPDTDAATVCNWSAFRSPLWTSPRFRRWTKTTPSTLSACTNWSRSLPRPRKSAPKSLRPSKLKPWWLPDSLRSPSARPTANAVQPLMEQDIQAADIVCEQAIGEAEIIQARALQIAEQDRQIQIACKNQEESRAPDGQRRTVQGAGTSCRSGTGGGLRPASTDRCGVRQGYNCGQSRLAVQLPALKRSAMPSA